MTWQDTGSRSGRAWVNDVSRWPHPGRSVDRASARPTGREVVITARASGGSAVCDTPCWESLTAGLGVLGGVLDPLGGLLGFFLQVLGVVLTLVFYPVHAVLGGSLEGIGGFLCLRLEVLAHFLGG